MSRDLRLATLMRVVASKRSTESRSTTHLTVVPNAPMTDEALVQGLREGHPGAFGVLYDRYCRAVRSALLRMMGSDRDVEDLCHETFLTVVKRCDAIREPAALKSFVLGCAIQLARNELRRRSVRRWVGLDTVPVMALPTEVYDSDQAEYIQRIYQVLNKLDAHSRVLFVLRHAEGYELPELAEMVGVSLATVKRHLAKAEERFENLSRRDPLLRHRLQTEEQAP